MDFLPPGSNLAIPGGPRREGIMVNSEKQNGIPSFSQAESWNRRVWGRGGGSNVVSHPKNDWELWSWKRNLAIDLG